MSLSEQRTAAIRTRLHAAFTPQVCEIIDESALHAGHAGAASGAGHFRIRLISPLFEGKNRLMRQRLVYDCLRDMMDNEIHALAMTTLAPSEASA